MSEGDPESIAVNYWTVSKPTLLHLLAYAASSKRDSDDSSSLMKCLFASIIFLNLFSSSSPTFNDSDGVHVGSLAKCTTCLHLHYRLMEIVALTFNTFRTVQSLITVRRNH